MQLSADAFGPTNRYGNISLAASADEAKVKWKGDAHNALLDAIIAIDAISSIAKLTN